jgi:hypothetical protein
VRLFSLALDWKTKLTRFSSAESEPSTSFSLLLPCTTAARSCSSHSFALVVLLRRAVTTIIPFLVSQKAQESRPSLSSSFVSLVFASSPQIRSQLLQG